MNNLPKLLITSLLLLVMISGRSNAQPYLSLFGLTAWGIPGGGDSGIPDESYFLLNANLPLSIGKKNLVLFTPFSEKRTLSGFDSQDNINLDGNGLFTNYIRYNSDSSRNFHNMPIWISTSLESLMPAITVIIIFDNFGDRLK